MKRVVTGGDLSQREMRPPDLLDAYLALVETDVRDFGLLEGRSAQRACPGCGGSGGPAFERLGFAYRRCEGCGSHFVSSLPDPARLARYHDDGQAERFWHETVLHETANVRSRHALGPRAHWVASTSAARLGTALTAYVNAHQQPALRDLLLGSPTFTRVTPVSFEKTIGTAGSGASEAAPADVIVAFETLERAWDLSQALAQCRKTLRPGGLLFVSTLSGSGFEVRLLGGRMRSLVPPVHLQLLSEGGWAAALKRAGFRLIEYSTPGELDVQAVAEACRRDPSLRLPPIIDELVRQGDEEVSHLFQEVLQQAGLSSHVQFVATAKESE